MSPPFLSHSARAGVVRCCGAWPVFQGRATARPAVLPPYDAGVGAELVSGLLDEVGLPGTLSERVDLVGAAHPFATSFPVVECAASVVGSIGAAASLLWEERTGEVQRVTVPRAHAGASLVGFLLQELEDGDLPVAPVSLDRPPCSGLDAGTGRHLTTRQVGGAALATLPGDGSARPPRGGVVPPRSQELPARAPGRRIRRARGPRRVGRRDLRLRGAAPLGEGAGRGRLDLPGLAGRARWPGGDHDRAGHLQRGVRPGRGPGAGQRHGRGAARPDRDPLRHTRAAGPLPPAHSGGQRALVPGLLRA